ncbi:hypothetical protein JYU34_001852 [Plutella xylostella]|uniref:Uncharacterized protein n=1 Tax=Plutella xylostella TaxID=51655 RepID=A0ABQ7R535_PLUXY|nr:hypothetical protein JYU34_001852 [Plutella xylostella]
MHNWRLLLLALLAAAQPGPSESFTDRTLIDGRCSDGPLQQRDTRDSIYGARKLDQDHRLSREVARDGRRESQRYESRDSRVASVERRVVDDRSARDSTRLTLSSFQVQDRVGADSRIAREVDARRVINVPDRIREVSRERSSRYARDVRQDGRSSREARQNELRHHRLFNDERITSRALREERNRVFTQTSRTTEDRPEVTRTRNEVARRSLSRDALRSQLERVEARDQRMNMRGESRRVLQERRSLDREMDATERRNIDSNRLSRTFNQRRVAEDDRRFVRDARDNDRREVMERSERSSMERSTENRQNRETRRVNNRDLSRERFSEAARVADERRSRSLELRAIHRERMESRNNDREARAFSRDARTAETQRRETRRSMERDSEIRDQRSTRLSRSDVETRRVDSRRIHEREIRDGLRSMDRRQIRSNERLDLARERRAVTDRLTRSVDRTPVVRSSDSRLSSEPERIREIRRTESRSTERYDAVRDSRARESRSFTGVHAQRLDTRRATNRRDVNTRDRLSNMPEESRRESRRTVERGSRMVREERSDMQSRARLAIVRDQRLELNRNSRQMENTREVRNVRDDTRSDFSRETNRMTIRQERVPSDRRAIRSEDSRRMNTRMSANDRSIDTRRENERNMRSSARDANRRAELTNERDSIRDTRIESRRVSRSERMSNAERRVDSRRENERLSRDIARREVRTGERRDTHDMRVKREVPETRFEARNLKSLERDSVDLSGRRNSWDAVNEKGQMESHSAMNWQYLLYTLQGLYLGSVILQMIGASDKNKMRSTGFWATTQKMLKVE